MNDFNRIHEKCKGRNNKFIYSIYLYVMIPSADLKHSENLYTHKHTHPVENVLMSLYVAQHTFKINCRNIWYVAILLHTLLGFPLESWEMCLRNMKANIGRNPSPLKSYGRITIDF